MKKGIVMGVALLLLGSTSAAASSQLNVTYKGYPVVNLNVNSQEIKSEIPAINMDGTTLVPLRFVSEALGSKVEWNGQSSTAIITSNMQSEVSIVIQDINSSIRDEISRFPLLIQQLQIAKEIYIYDQKTYEINLISNGYITELESNYKVIYNRVLDLHNKFPNETVRITELTDDLLKYNQLIKTYKDALEQLVRYTERSDKKEHLSAFYSFLSQLNKKLLANLALINTKHKPELGGKG
ncbi:MAG: Extracellular ligand-binding receptor [Paenibacillus sp.]|jgi:hypothetical protein|nr:Extracellular ligand-binding receptor [Paenibacillus sp.]